MLQPRGVELAEQETFIDEALLMADVLLLILGSSYAEAVDQLGGRVHTAMVGPALPEVNAVQDAKMDAHPSLQRQDQFRDIYIIPAMRRIRKRLADWSVHRGKMHGFCCMVNAMQKQLTASNLPPNTKPKPSYTTTRI